MRRFDRLTGSPGNSQKEGQEDQLSLKQVGGFPPAPLPLPGPPGLSPGLPLALTGSMASLADIFPGRRAIEDEVSDLRAAKVWWEERVKERSEVRHMGVSGFKEGEMEEWVSSNFA